MEVKVEGRSEREDLARRFGIEWRPSARRRTVLNLLGKAFARLEKGSFGH